MVLCLAEPKFVDGLTELAKVLIKNKFLSREFAFLSRTESGMCNLLHALKARVATTQIALAVDVATVISKVVAVLRRSERR